jgi:two-component system response regulator
VTNPLSEPVVPIEVLLVEDDPGDVLMTREAFADYKVKNNLHVVSDGVEALSFLRGEGEFADSPRPDLILLDLNLPLKDGRQVLAEVKSDDKLRRIPVVVLTTSEAEEDVLRSYDLHANAYITKPVDFERFVDVVRHIDDFFVSVVRLPGPRPGRRTNSRRFRWRGPPRERRQARSAGRACPGGRAGRARRARPASRRRPRRSRRCAGRS